MTIIRFAVPMMLLVAGLAAAPADIHDAVKAGNMAAVTALLDQSPALVNARDQSGRTPLHWAARGTVPALVTLLVERGAEVNAVDGTGFAPLYLCAARGNLTGLALLLDKGASINIQAGDSSTPLHGASDMGRSEAVTFLLGKGADLRATTIMGQSACNLAQDNGDAAMSALLVGEGADTTPVRFPELRGPYLGQKPPGRTPEIFAPGIVSARHGMHSNVVFSPDGTEPFWSLMIPPRGSAYSTGRTVVSRLVQGRWTYPQPALFDGTPLDDVPFVHPGAQRLYDMSRRRLPDGKATGKENIWVWEKGGKGWTNPRPLDPSVNRLPHHWQFSVDRSGTLYFSSTWGGARGIFSSRLVDGRYAEPENLGPAVGPDAGLPFVAPDGSYLLFTRGTEQLCVSFRDPQGRWGEAISLGPEFAGMLPIVSPDGKYLFLSRNQRACWADAAVIEQLRGSELPHLLGRPAQPQQHRLRPGLAAPHLRDRAEPRGLLRLHSTRPLARCRAL